MHKRSNTGFSLIELVIAMLIVSVLTAVALPSYTQYVTKSRRAAAEACLANYANYMERFYATNMRYDQTAVATPVSVRPLPSLDCATTSNTGQYYAYDVETATLTQSAYFLTATPKAGTTQLKKDTKCGTLKLNEKGVRSVTGTGSVTDCWAH